MVASLRAGEALYSYTMPRPCAGQKLVTLGCLWTLCPYGDKKELAEFLIKQKF